MKKRAGASAKISADARLLQRMHELVKSLGGPSLTDRERKEIDAVTTLVPHERRVRRKRA